MHYEYYYIEYFSHIIMYLQNENMYTVSHPALSYICTIMPLSILQPIYYISNDAQDFPQRMIQLKLVLHRKADHSVY